MSVTYLLGAMRFVRWFFLVAGCGAMALCLVEVGIDVSRVGFVPLHAVMPASLLVALFVFYRFTEVLLLLSLNATLRDLYRRGIKLTDDELSQRVRKEIARRARFQEIACSLRGEEMPKVLDLVCGPQTDGKNTAHEPNAGS
jgi:hypothetical protein